MFRGAQGERKCKRLTDVGALFYWEPTHPYTPSCRRVSIVSPALCFCSHSPRQSDQNSTIFFSINPKEYVCIKRSILYALYIHLPLYIILYANPMTCSWRAAVILNGTSYKRRASGDFVNPPICDSKEFTHSTFWLRGTKIKATVHATPCAACSRLLDPPPNPHIFFQRWLYSGWSNHFFQTLNLSSLAVVWNFYFHFLPIWQFLWQFLKTLVFFCNMCLSLDFSHPFVRESSWVRVVLARAESQPEKRFAPTVELYSNDRAFSTIARARSCSFVLRLGESSSHCSNP